MAHCSLFNLKMNVTKSYLFLHNSSTLSSKNLAQTWQFRRNWTKNVYKKKKKKRKVTLENLVLIHCMFSHLGTSHDPRSTTLLFFSLTILILFYFITLCPLSLDVCTFYGLSLCFLHLFTPPHTHSHVSDLWFIGTHTHSDTPLHPDTWGIAVPPILRFWLSKIEFLLKMLLATEQADGQNV